MHRYLQEIVERIGAGLYTILAGSVALMVDRVFAEFRDNHNTLAMSLRPIVDFNMFEAYHSDKNVGLELF